MLVNGMLGVINSEVQYNDMISIVFEITFEISKLWRRIRSIFI